MIVDYQPWQPQQFSPLKAELIGTIRADQATLVALPGIGVLGTIVPFIPFGTGTQIAEVPSATPTVTSTSTRTPTVTPTLTHTPFIPMGPTWTPTSTETSTPWLTAVPPIVPPPLPTVQFDGVASTIDEGAGNITITVTLSAASSQPITVTYFTSDGTANAPTDYTSTTDVLAFPPGQTVLTFDIPVVSDGLDEDDETLQVALITPVNAALGAPNAQVITILDDDLPCTTGFTGPYTLDDARLGAVDDSSLDVGCGQAILIELVSLPAGPTPIVADGDESTFDLAVYERRNGLTGTIEMDWVVIEVGTSSTGPWLTVFNWGDGYPDPNTSVWQNGFTWTEADNELIPMTNPPLRAVPTSPLLITGIAIDIDAFVPPGEYGWIRVSTPLYGGNDPSQVDYIEIIP